MDLALASVLGLVVGIVTGAVGAGGSILTIPALMYLLGQSPRAAAIGSLIIVGVSSIVGVVQHDRGGRVRWKDGLTFSAIGAITAVVGAQAAGLVSDWAATVSFAVLLLLASAALVNTAGVEADRRRPGWMVIAVAALAGLLTGFFGVGGGFVVVPALILVLGFSAADAVGTSLLVIALNSFVALVFRLGHTDGVDWPVIVAFGLTASIGGAFGSRITARLDPKVLTNCLAVVLTVIASAMLVEQAIT
ncbi:sulfite exporter TauE/SafE family protein [Yimella sp. cx-51]|uniref:sulfite exporter TauE/SafE family protein n=1 Tax=Yimella sp. cx-51 TaxID=2770551 RepID=UPI00165D859E|nr:sulfite exporter TauE/SafE family protein [Yimella sp. cx-51]MBC9958293.1 sulfite exporter TauE/SafE family protein [Yimella sp. cx-51]QTH38259.1 sulfite exporter TauE/SafE family protein [Yimella sp. cx-51]